MRSLRVSTLCDHNDIEDEFHFILPFYSDIRKMYVKSITIKITIKNVYKKVCITIKNQVCSNELIYSVHKM